MIDSTDVARQITQTSRLLGSDPCRVFVGTDLVPMSNVVQMYYLTTVDGTPAFASRDYEDVADEARKRFAGLVENPEDFIHVGVAIQ